MNRATVVDLQTTSEAAPGPHLLARIRVLMRFAELDRAIFYGIVHKLWQAGTGPLTALLVIVCFSPEMQGFYYTFLSMLMLQVFAELGLGQVIIQFASHEWAHLRLNQEGYISGDPEAFSRLLSLGRFAIRWYSVAAVLTAAGLSIGGFVFFSHSTPTTITWASPWFALCLMSAVMLALIPAWALLEGCNQIAEVYRFRFVESALHTVALSTAIALGAGLWSPAISTAAKLVYNVTFLSGRYRGFFASFRLSSRGQRIGWRLELWSLQWKFALSWLAGYFCFSLFTPVAFRYHGAVVAGQVGLTLSMANGISAIATTWVFSKAPTFGVLIARRDHASLDDLMFRAARMGLIVAAGAASLAWLAVYLLNAWRSSLALRLLTPLPTGLFLMAVVLMQLSYPQSVYLRAHKQEPFLGLSIASAVLIGLSTWILGRRFGPTGMAAGYAAVTAFIVVPVGTIIWLRCRARWHAPAQGPSAATAVGAGC